MYKFVSASTLFTTENFANKRLREIAMAAKGFPQTIKQSKENDSFTSVSKRRMHVNDFLVLVATTISWSGRISRTLVGR